MAETLNLPHFIAGRFDLSIKLIYQGLLLGTGPQVDPGFQGRLSCPLHNISKSPIYIRLHESFVKIDFEKTTGFAVENRQWLHTISSEQSIYDSPENLKGHNGILNVLFSAEKRNREPIKDYQQYNRPAAQSSLKDLEVALRGMRTWFSRLAIGSAFAIAIAVVGPVLTVFQMMQEAINSAENDTERVQELLQTVESQQEQLFATQEAMAQGVLATQSAFEDRIAILEATPKPSDSGETPMPTSNTAPHERRRRE
jgi:hypothetical protein